MVYGLAVSGQVNAEL